MNILINYANKPFRRARFWNSLTGRYIAGFDKVIEYSDTDIDDDFKRKNQKILSIKRGNGLWLWKPYFILRTLQCSQENDIIFYCDSGSFFIRRITPVLKIMEYEDFWITEIPFIERQFTRREVFEALDCNAENFGVANQAQAGFLAFRKNAKTIAFVSSWLEKCCDFRLLSDTDSMQREECSEFIDSREDQSILSLLAKKNKLTFYQDPSQYGKFPEQYSTDAHVLLRFSKRRDYSVLIVLHRLKTFDFRVLFRSVLFAFFPERLGHKLMHRDFGNILQDERK